MTKPCGKGALQGDCYAVIKDHQQCCRRARDIWNVISVGEQEHPIITLGPAHLQGFGEGLAGAAPGQGGQQHSQRLAVLRQQPVQLLLRLDLNQLPRMQLWRSVLLSNIRSLGFGG